GAKSSKALTIATYNLNAGMAGNATTMRALEAIDADVIFLQESSAGWERLIRRRLGKRYPHMAFEVRGRQPWGSLGVLSKAPFRHRSIAPKSGPFPAWLVELRTRSGTVRVLNVHLFPPVRWFARLGWMKAYAESQKIHQRELAEHFARVGGPPDLVVGDFNEDLLGRGMRWLERRGFRSAITRRTNTWRWKTRIGIIRWPLDHVMLGKGWKAVRARVVDAGSSDHLPVVVTLSRL
ncbi:MAG: endonuclease/exonuclease/phosphatase family protein, partial [Deltaproteobacteria bacterium]|nr:endonuclease/exonuclease/phosphatase family protein [Deltaproteobacteria bacterium]